MVTVFSKWSHLTIIAKSSRETLTLCASWCDAGEEHISNMLFLLKILVLTLIKENSLINVRFVAWIQAGQLAWNLQKRVGGQRNWKRFKKPNTQIQCVNFDWICVMKKKIIRHFMEQWTSLCMDDVIELVSVFSGVAMIL